MLVPLSSHETGKWLRRALAIRVLGEKRLRLLEAKQRKVDKSWETIGIGPDSVEDCAKRRLSSWGFAARWRLELETQVQFDTCASDWADFQFLDGEGPDTGERLRAALGRWAVTNAKLATLPLHRFKRILKSWRKNHPKKSRLPMPEGFWWALVGWLGHHCGLEKALYTLALFPTYLRPGALLGLFAANVIPPQQGMLEHSRYVLVISPFEKEISTKSGYFDETVVLDGDLAPELGPLLHAHALRRAEEVGGDPEDVNMWTFSASELLQDFRAGVSDMQLPDMDSPYQARHGGASRDFLLKKRSSIEIQLRGFWATLSSMRIYNKPGRLQKLVNAADASVIAYAGEMRRSYADCFRSGVFPVPPSVRPTKKQRCVS